MILLKKNSIDNELFIALGEQRIIYNFGNDIVRYWINKNRRGQPVFWDGFIDRLPMEIPSIGYTQKFQTYTHHYSMYIRRKHRESEPLKTMAINKDLSYVSLLMDSLAINHPGFGKDILLTHEFSSAADRPAKREVCEKYLPKFFKLVENEDCKNHIKNLYGLDTTAQVDIDFIDKLDSYQLNDTITIRLVFS